MFNALNNKRPTTEVIKLVYKIKEIRKCIGMSQTELAEKSGVSRGTICALENGMERVTTTKTLLRIAQALSVTVDDLFSE